MSSSSNNKRVAKNTLFLYFRMILIMLVTLYTSRVVLAELGIKDYGIYNVVGGVVAMFSFLNNCMSSATQRFMTFELGRGDMARMKKVFAASLNIHITIGVIIVLLAETIGLWFVNHKLVIAPDRMTAANWVYQFSILTFCVNIIQVPYNAVLIAHEKMSVYAYISILEAFLKLGIVYLLVIVPADKLIAYGILVFAVQLIIRGIYQVYCRRHYVESKFKLFWDKGLYKQMSGFAGWNLFGSVAWLLRDQGLNIVLNLFFGTAINAARGVASQVSSAVMGFISNFQVALNPQITKNYATGNIPEMEKLSYLGIKFSFLLLFTMAFPLCLNIDYVLHLWLVEVPDYTALFIILIMVDSLAGNLFGVPLMTSLSATGKIRNYQIVVSCIILCILPAGYVALRLGYDAPSVFYISIVFTLVSGFVRFLFCRKQIGYSLRSMAREVLLPIAGVSVLSLPLPIVIKSLWLGAQTFANFILLCVIAASITVVVSWVVGLKSHERQTLVNVVKNKFHKK
jgi:Na+-driven multidrug efflux pump